MSEGEFIDELLVFMDTFPATIFPLIDDMFILYYSNIMYIWSLLIIDPPILFIYNIFKPVHM